MYTKANLLPQRNHFVGFNTLWQTCHRDIDTDFPAYNIEQHAKDAFCIRLALPGVDESEIELTQQDQTLTVSYEPVTENKPNYIHHGFEQRSFCRQFQLADHTIVQSADINKGILTINLLKTIPEEKQPKKIQINAQAVDKTAIESV